MKKTISTLVAFTIFFVPSHMPIAFAQASTTFEIVCPVTQQQMGAGNKVEFKVFKCAMPAHTIAYDGTPAWFFSKFDVTIHRIPSEQSPTVTFNAAFEGASKGRYNTAPWAFQMRLQNGDAIMGEVQMGSFQMGCTPSGSVSFNGQLPPKLGDLIPNAYFDELNQIAIHAAGAQESC
ncbi:hypothetical protein [Mesorhizobium sp.]|uniref:hypothetical protein n=1 Tax=Mesorhizobium sp. TaxID=1871066 RepID=UPI003BA92DC9